MSYNFKDNRGMIIETISFRDATGLSAENIAECMREEAAAPQPGILSPSGKKIPG